MYDVTHSQIVLRAGILSLPPAFWTIDTHSCLSVRYSHSRVLLDDNCFDSGLPTTRTGQARPGRPRPPRPEPSGGPDGSVHRLRPSVREQGAARGGVTLRHREAWDYSGPPKDRNGFQHIFNGDPLGGLYPFHSFSLEHG